MAVGSGLFPFTELQVQFQSALCLVLRRFPDHWVHARFHGSWKKHFFSKSKCSHIGMWYPNLPRYYFSVWCMEVAASLMFAFSFTQTTTCCTGRFSCRSPAVWSSPWIQRKRKWSWTAKWKEIPGQPLGLWHSSLFLCTVPTVVSLAALPTSHSIWAQQHPRGGSLSADTKEKHTLGSPCIATRL